MAVKQRKKKCDSRALPSLLLVFRCNLGEEYGGTGGWRVKEEKEEEEDGEKQEEQKEEDEREEDERRQRMMWSRMSTFNMTTIKNYTTTM